MPCAALPECQYGWNRGLQYVAPRILKQRREETEYTKPTLYFLLFLFRLARQPVLEMPQRASQGRRYLMTTDLNPFVSPGDDCVNQTSLLILF